MRVQVPPEVLFKLIYKFNTAGIAQLVERQPSKLNVAGSSPVSRSNFTLLKLDALVVELVDTQDLKSCVH